MDIYIKPKKQAAVYGQDGVLVRDVCETTAPADIKALADGLELPGSEPSKPHFLISSLDVIAAINRAVPDCVVHCIGETETLVERRNKETPKPRLWTWVKVAAMCLVFAFGASSAVMSFHNDAEIPKVLQAYNKMFTGVDDPAPRAAQVPYSIGLALGIIGFFGHFCGKKLTGDPSPIEIEASKYNVMIGDARIGMIKSNKDAS